MTRYLFPMPAAGELEQVATNALVMNDYWLGIIEGLLTPLTYEWKWADFTNEIETGAVNAMTPVSVLPFYGVKVYRANNTAIAQNVNTLIEFETVEHDTAVFWDAGDPERLVAPLDGFYHVAGSISFAVNSTGRRRLRVLYNDGVAAGVVIGDGNVQATSAGNTVSQVTTDIYMNAGDWIEMTAFQDTTAPLNLIGGRSQSWATLKLMGVLTA